VTVTTEFVAPRTTIEAAVAEIFAEILQLPAVGVQHDFFALGGHSLLATQVMSRIRSKLHVDLPLRVLFEEPTVAGLAARIESAGASSFSTRAPAIEPARRDGDLQLSFAQERLWFLDELEPGSAFYTVPFVLALEGEVDIDVLARSFRALVDRHEILRTTFSTKDGTPFQVIHPSLDVAIAHLDLRSRPEAERRDAALELAREDASKPFDLARGPLVRAAIYTLADDERWLYVALHHIVTDGWSTSVLCTELAAIYSDLSQGKPPSLPPLAIQYADFAAWQRSWLAAGELDKQLSYWKGQLSGAPSLLELPTDRPRPPVQSFRGALTSIALDAELMSAVQDLSRATGTTTFMTLLAVFQILLRRHSGQQDIVVGSPIANRNHPETEALIGFFVNTLVLRTDLAGDPSFNEVLARVRQTALGAYAHQDLPFERLVAELQPARSASYSPMFQVMFVLQNAPAGPELPGLSQEVIELETATAKFDLMLVIDEKPDGAVATFEYATDLFDASTIDRMLEHFQVLLRSAISDPARPISKLEILGPAEKQTLLGDYLATNSDVATDRCVQELFEDQVAARPDAIAVKEGDRQLTYRELDALAEALASRLVELGAGPESVIGVVTERSIELVISWLAAWKAGACYVPIDPRVPHERRAFMLADAGANIILHHRRTADLVAGLPGTHIAVDEVVAGARAPRPSSCVDNIAYVIYTSGSTGRPKGVMITHRALLFFIDGWGRRFGITPSDIHSVAASPAFDVAQSEIWPVLAIGGTVDMIDDEVRSDPELMWKFMVERKITLAFAAPAVGEMMLDIAPPPSTFVLRALWCGGDRLRKSPPAGCGFALFNGYGPTENTVLTTGGEIPAGTPTPSIGTPMPHVQVYIVDENLAPVPIGVVGDLYAGGAYVGRGYLNRPALTAAGYLPDPFSPVPGARMYKTGDRCRYRADGTIEFLGRADHQVKIRGFRIELGEIEIRLGEHPSVRECVVIAREDSPGDKRLVAYVVFEGAERDISALKAHLEVELPDYMVPAIFVELDQLPLTSNGKLDRPALPAPTVTGSYYIAPRTHAELVIARIFSRLLGVALVSAQDDFFELGGHSLLATQLFAAIATELSVKLPVSTVFQAPTVEQLARLVDARVEPAQTNLVTLRSRGAGAPLVLVHAVGGTVFAYQALVARLGADRPCYAFEALGLAAGETPRETVEEMAAAYAKELLAVQPQGPFHLCGWSFGGVVVVELAKVLRAAGHEVLSAVLIDSFAPSAFATMAIDPMATLAEYAADLGVEVDLDELRGLTAEAALAHVTAQLHTGGAVPPHIGVDQIARRVGVFAANMRAIKQYRPGAVEAPLVVLRASEGDSDPAETWRAHGAVTEIAVPGNHHSMVTPPHVDELARTIDAVLGRGLPS
jgi:amino acid adenylation domain-containing protein